MRKLFLVKNDIVNRNPINVAIAKINFTILSHILKKVDEIKLYFPLPDSKKGLKEVLAY